MIRPSKRCLRVWSVGLVTGCGPAASGSDGDLDTQTSTSGPTQTSTSGSTVEPNDSDPLAESGSTSTDTESTGEMEPEPACESPWPNVTMIACTAIGSASTLAVDGTMLYYESGTSIFRVDALDGHEPELLVSEAGDVRQILVVGDHLYWAAFFEGAVGRLHVPSGEQEVVDGFVNVNGVAVDGDLIYITEYTEGGTLSRISPAEGWSSTALYTELSHPGRLLGDEGTLFWALSTNNGNIPTPIVRGSTAGAEMETVHSDTGTLSAMVLEEDVFFVGRYRSGGSSIERTPVDAPELTQILADTEHPSGLALTDERVYWTAIATDEQSNYGWLRSVPKTGGSVVEHLDHTDGLYRVAVAATDVVVFRTREGVARLDE